jgi:small subunit ribosomal protein S6
MEKKICSYETLFTISGNLTEEDYKALCEKFVTLINDNASDVTVNEWGKRRLAYPINYITEGYYVLVNFKSEPDFPRELSRVFGITEGIIRYMTTAKEVKATSAAPVVAEEVSVEEAAPAAEATEE